MNRYAGLSKRPVRVTSPHQVTWTARFKDGDAAWGRILGLHKYADTKHNREVMAQRGWKVETEVTTEKDTP